ncbi:MAG: efflux RND transporter permease subunit, partial [Puniceicoccales bacterium]|nr:efflux RND transporter permease subunit [Puniceicoccales bacterium]
MARFFIDRPVFAWVIAIFLMVAGALSITQLPVAQYPTIASPAVNVRVVYPGATAETLHLTVTDLIGQELNGIEGLRYYEVSNEANGRATITATFMPGTNQDLAAVDVQNRIKRVESRIPEIVKSLGIQIEKSMSGFLCMVALYSPDGSLTNDDLGDYAARNILNEIKRVPGVGSAQLLASEKSMRIWVDPQKLVGLNLSFAQVNGAIVEQNNQIPAGILGLRPSPRITQNTITLVTNGQLSNVEQFENILLRANADGSSVRLRDVARVELGAAEYGFEGHYNGKMAANIIVQLTPTANALATANGVKACMERLRQYFPKSALGKIGEDGKPIELAFDYAVPYDTSTFITVSIMAVVRTLIEAIALVFVVMFLFLQNIRYTFIPIIVIPVALLGTFAVLLSIGLSINVLTMFGMVLVIGILVDDAIVVVENVERIMREEHLSPRDATRKAMKQITSAIIGMTLVLASVFIPMAFFPGAVGIIYRQFSLTMVAAILFSALLALTLTPALCANLIKPHDGAPLKRRGLAAALFLIPDIFHRYVLGIFFNGTVRPLPAVVSGILAALGVAFGVGVYFSSALHIHGELLMALRGLLIFAAVYCLLVAGGGFNPLFEKFSGAYEKLTRQIVRFAFVVMLGYAAIVGGFGQLYTQLPASFIPQEDQGTLLNIVQLPASASAHRTAEVFRIIEEHYLKDPAVNSIGGVIGFSMAGAGENAGMMFVNLKHWSQRGPEDTAAKVRERALAKIMTIRDAYIIMPILPPAIAELGMSAGVTFNLLDRGANGHARLLQARNTFLGLIFADAAKDIAYATNAAAIQRGEKPPVPTGPQTAADLTNLKFRAVFSRQGTRPDGLEDSPQLQIDIDRDAAGAMGISFGEITSTLNTAIGSAYVNDFPNRGRMQRVTVQAESLRRISIDDLMNLHLRNAAGDMVPFSTVGKATWINGATQVLSYNGYPTMRLEAVPAPGRSTGEAMDKIREFEKTLATMGFQGFATEWTKQTLEESEVTKPVVKGVPALSGLTMNIALVGISLLFVFLLMAALYESWSIPFAVMLVVPVGAFGAVVAVTLRGMPNDIYFLIGMVAIIGLSAKNAILIIEFAKEQQLLGKDLLAATIEGAKLRFRPILMTSFAFILGVWPLFTASG